MLIYSQELKKDIQTLQNTVFYSHLVELPSIKSACNCRRDENKLLAVNELTLNTVNTTYANTNKASMILKITEI